jgi:hypothetical protein
MHIMSDDEVAVAGYLAEVLSGDDVLVRAANMVSTLVRNDIVPIVSNGRDGAMVWLTYHHWSPGWLITDVDPRLILES